MSVEAPRPYHERALVSDRDGEKLAGYYGYESLGELVGDLPPGAEVADLGAGKSSLGIQVCRLRPDVTWLSIDRKYDSMRPYSRFRRRRVPPNFNYVAGDVLALPAAVKERRFAVVLSYWMLPYITLDSRESGLRAADTMLHMAQPTGTVAVGPCASLETSTEVTDTQPFPPALSGQAPAAYAALAVQLSGEESNLGRLAEEIVEATTLTPEGAARLKKWIDAPPMPPAAYHLRYLGISSPDM